MYDSNVFILFSGGLDSSALISYYSQLDFNIKLLWVNYNQFSSKMEELAVTKISKFYNLELIKLNIDFCHLNMNKYEYVGRNLALISIGCMTFPYKYGLLSTGIRSGSYKDCTVSFCKMAKKIVEDMSDGNIILDIPLYDYTKKDIIQYCLNNKTPINYTYSCQKGSNIPCGECSSCLEIEKAYGELNLLWEN